MLRYVLTTVSACALCLTAPAIAKTPPSPAVDMPIIDMHLHALGANDQGPAPMPVCAPFLNWPIRDPDAPPEAYFGAFMNVECPNKLISPKSDDELREQTLAIVRKDHILAVTSGTADMVETWRKEAPDNIIPGIMFALSDQPSLDALRKLHAEGRLKVIGELAEQYEGVSIADPRVDPLLALAEELDVPVGVHMGPGPPGAPYLGAPAYRMKLSDPLQLEDVLAKHPKLRIYVMHAGWPMLDNMIALMYAFPQVYVDTGVIDYVLPKPEFDRYLKTLVDAGMGKRIMFGSDNMVWPQSIDIAIGNIKNAPYLTAGQKRDILYNNAARFLKLPDAK